MGQLDRYFRVTAMYCMASCALLVVCGCASLRSDPSPSWNEGKVKQSIVGFVATVTTSGSPDFVAVPERITTFDNDGTLWTE